FDAMGRIARPIMHEPVYTENTGQPYCCASDGNKVHSSPTKLHPMKPHGSRNCPAARSRPGRRVTSWDSETRPIPRVLRLHSRVMRRELARGDTGSMAHRPSGLIARPFG